MGLDLPPLQTGEAVWDRDSINALPPGAKFPKWIEFWTPQELDALSVASDRVLELSPKQGQEGALSLRAVEEEMESLQNTLVGRRARSLLDTMLYRHGFVLLKGLPVDDWGRAKSGAAFLLLSRLMGPLRMQNALGHMLGHIRDLGMKMSDPSVRVYQTSDRQTFHTDPADIVGLLCLRQAMKGGESAIVSAGAIYNEIYKSRPDLLRLLLEPFAIDRRGEMPPGAEHPFFLIPVYTSYEGYLSVNYHRTYINSAQRFEAAPKLTPAHVEALDLFDKLMDEDRLQCTMNLEPGDIQFLHNHNLLHDRLGWVDSPEPEEKRHLFRTWVAPPEIRPLAPAFAAIYGSVVPGDRGGIYPDGSLPSATWHPPPDVYPQTSRAGR